jgi:hypothetical protein
LFGAYIRLKVRFRLALFQLARYPALMPPRNTSRRGKALARLVRQTRLAREFLNFASLFANPKNIFPIL